MKCKRPVCTASAWGDHNDGYCSQECRLRDENRALILAIENLRECAGPPVGHNKGKVEVCAACYHQPGKVLARAAQEPRE